VGCFWLQWSSTSLFRGGHLSGSNSHEHCGMKASRGFSPNTSLLSHTSRHRMTSSPSNNIFIFLSLIHNQDWPLTQPVAIMECTNCKKPATAKCSICDRAPVLLGDAAIVSYCGDACRKADCESQVPLLLDFCPKRGSSQAKQTTNFAN
jgi:hypothetical protein